MISSSSEKSSSKLRVLRRYVDPDEANRDASTQAADRLANAVDTMSRLTLLLRFFVSTEATMVMYAGSTLTYFYAERRRAEGSLALDEDAFRGVFGEHRLQKNDGLHENHRLNEDSAIRADTHVLHDTLHIYSLVATGMSLPLNISNVTSFA